MATGGPRLVLDAWAVLAVLQGEPPGQTVLDLLADCLENGGEVLMTVVNVGEVWYNVSRRRTEADADHAIKALRELGVRFVDAEWELTRLAARYKTKGKLSFADAFALALAKSSKCDLVTGDPELKRAAADVKVRWLA